MTRPTSLESFRRLARAGGMVPIVREFAADTLTPVSAYAAVAQPPFGFLLESLIGGERWARYTFLGTEPGEAWRYQAGRAERWTPDTAWEPAGPAPNPLAHVGDLMRRRVAVPDPSLPRFTGGAVGSIAYDAVRALERLPGGPADDLATPDAVFMLADTVVAIDNLFARALVVANVEVARGAKAQDVSAAYTRGIDRIDGLLERLAAPPHLRPVALETSAAPATESPYPAEAFARDVERIKEHIRAGDVYQAVLSRRQDLPCRAEAFDVYRALRALNPAPYLYFLAFDDMALAGSSPEVLVRVEDGEVTVRPIAGTRPRGMSPDEDDCLAAELLADAKELAEHAMLVDLGRNDVGRVADYGTVRVTELRAVERYSHVQHIVSEVRGHLRNGLDAVDALAACFPAGTVSGAPKLRAMELLDGLEPTRRGPYAGAVGYVGWGAATMDTAITIRTALLRNGRAHVQAGAGIVADSDPARELEETENKAGAVLRALALADAH